MSEAAAPSVRKLELAAVGVPCGLINAGLSLDTDSMVEPNLIPFSSVYLSHCLLSSSINSLRTKNLYNMEKNM